MKKYRISIIDWSIANDKARLRNIVTKYVTGIKEARKLCPPLHYCRNANAWFSYKNELEYVVCEVL